MAEERNTESMSPEATLCQAEARKHLRQLREFWIIFVTTGVVILAILALAIQGGLGWFVSNTRVNQSSLQVSAAGAVDFALATVGRKEQGVYDRLFGLTASLPTQTIGGTTYSIGAGNGSLHLNSDQNLNNYLDNADLRPGNRGNFDLYIICRTEKREVTLQPVFSAWYEVVDPEGSSYADAFSPDAPDAKKIAAKFLTGHFLLFAHMDEKGMYSGNIDFTQPVALNLSTGEARQGTRTFRWGEQVGDTPVYRLRVYWVWAEQFGNFVYTGNSYQKNLFAKTDLDDYTAMNDAMMDKDGCQRFFKFPTGATRPPIHNQISTQVYELYSGWYDAADEAIGTEIAYLELGFALLPGSGE